ncbi:MAG TPA: STAS domain-containing protein [Solirubrobacteraceae bacterium]|nr:STAS domain-containing protein [Solirubrobacteraceae bacterium]
MISPQSPTLVNPAQLTIGRREQEGGVILTVRGEVDIASAPWLDRELRHAEESSPNRIVLDLADLDFIDSSGVCLLMDARRRADSDGRLLALIGVPAHARRLFQITGVETALLG